MKFGVREICDVVLRAKANQKIGNKIFYKDEPVLYFDSLKTSSMEGAATTVYAQGGRGNARLVAWEGERTITFTMEDALISTVGFAILSGAGLIEGGDKGIQVHNTERTTVNVDGGIYLEYKPYVNGNENLIYVMKLDNNGEVHTEPYIYTYDGSEATADGYKITLKTTIGAENSPEAGDSVLVDYYTTKFGSRIQQIEITADKFGGNYYLEASTLFRDAATGQDMPAEFIIPNCKVQSNFTFTMASSGDPSTFTFTMDAFPDYTRFDNKKKVLAAIQVISDGGSESAVIRETTPSLHSEKDGLIVDDDGFDVEKFDSSDSLTIKEKTYYKPTINYEDVQPVRDSDGKITEYEGYEVVVINNVSYKSEKKTWKEDPTKQ